jgi:hypothetical protein
MTATPSTKTVRIFASTLICTSAWLSPLFTTSARAVSFDADSTSVTAAPTTLVVRNGPVIEILQSNGQWIVGTLQSLDEHNWSLIPTQPVDAEAILIARANVVAFFVTKIDASSRGVANATSLRATAPTRETTATAPFKSTLSMSTPLSLGILTSTDGQRLPGTFRVVNGKPVWEHRWIGAVGADIDRIASIQMLADRPVVRKLDRDTLVLLNGDAVSGFVETLGDDVVLAPIQGAQETIAAETSKSPDPIKGAADDAVAPTDSTQRDRHIPMERVATLGFADVPVTQRLGADVWTVDGSIVGGRNIRFDQTTGWSFSLATDWLESVRPSATTDNTAADAIAVIFERNNFLPLANCQALEPTVPAESFRYSTAQSVRIAPSDRFLLGCADISLDGPIIASFILPRDVIDRAESAIFCGELVLAEPAPADARVGVSIEVLGETPQQFTLNAQTRRVKVSIPASSTKRGLLTIRLDDGANGSVGDRVIIERAAFIIAPDHGSRRE